MATPIKKFSDFPVGGISDTSKAFVMLYDKTEPDPENQNKLLSIAGLLSYISPINNIGVPGHQGFGVGICPEPPIGMSEMAGTTDPASGNYGNYQFTDGSIMVWIPAFYYKMGTGLNGVAINDASILPLAAYESVSTANLDGYALHRAFYNGGEIQPGVFVDKYHCSDNGGIASSIKMGNPLSTNDDHNPLTLVGATSNYLGVIAAAKTRGSSFFPSSIFIFKALALLSLAHAQASSSTTNCAWYDPAGITNFPKGCNNNALGDHNDPTLTFVGDGYQNVSKTGSANILAKTTHNGQDCGVVDVNGCMWNIALGITTDSGDPATGNFYVLSTTAAIETMTAGTSSETDFWGATGLAANFDDLGPMTSFTGFALNFSGRNLMMGSASQVLSGDVDGVGWQMAGAGVPLVTGGSNLFGNDRITDSCNATLTPIAGGGSANAADSGVWALSLNGGRGRSLPDVGFRAALYL